MWRVYIRCSLCHGRVWDSAFVMGFDPGSALHRNASPIRAFEERQASRHAIPRGLSFFIHPQAQRCLVRLIVVDRGRLWEVNLCLMNMIEEIRECHQGDARDHFDRSTVAVSSASEL